MSIDAIPPELAGLKQFCLREGKRPFIRDVDKGGFTPGWTNPAGWMVLAEALEELERNKSRGFDGIGYLNAKAPDSSRQITGGDLDASRDPITGWVSLWAREFLEQTRPFYCEVSPSGCGLRFFYLARLPNRANSLFGSGPQDMPDEAKEHIIAANPKVKEKIDKGQPAFNGLELYEDKRHLTITGNTLKEFCYSIEDRTEALAGALELAGIVAREKPKPTLSAAEIEQMKRTLKRQGLTDEQTDAFLQSHVSRAAEDGQDVPPGGDELPGWAGEMEQEASKNRLPHISILDVIDTRGWEETGDQLRGPHPILGSSTGHNLVVNPGENIWANMHAGLQGTGGDAWTWLACECGAVKWEEAGAGALKDPAVFDKTIKYAIEKGYVKAEDIPRRQAGIIALGDIAYTTDEEGKDWKFSPTMAAKALLTRLNLAMTPDSDKIYYFNNQIFKEDGERLIDRVLCMAGEDFITERNLRETLRRVRNKLLDKPVSFDPDPYLLGVKNGAVNLLTGEARNYRPEDLITDQIPVSYDPAARCPAFLAFLESITPNISDRITLIDWFVATAIREPLPYVLFLLGLGRNGKGIYERLMKKFFGKSAFRDMPLAEVRKNNFAAGGFYKKRGWIASETGKRKERIGTDFIKLTSGNGVIDSDRKNQSRIQFEPFFQTTVDTNTMPQIDDNSKGWLERFVKVDLPYIFLADPDPNNQLEKQGDPGLFEKLTTESELSGILNLLLFRSQAIGKSGQIHKRAGSEMFTEYNEQSSSVATFIELFCEYDASLFNLKTPSMPIYEAYKEWCSYKVGEVVDIRYFGRQLKQLCDGREPNKDKDKDRKTIKTYTGLIFNVEAYQAAMQALRLSMSPLCLHMSPSSLHEEEEEKSLLISMSPLSPLKQWNLILEKFGDSSNVHNCTLDSNSLYRKENQKIMETMETMETSIASEPLAGESNGDRMETSMETNPEAKPKAREKPEKKASVRILPEGGYRTQIPDPENPMKFVNHFYSHGEVVNFDSQRAKDLVERGIAVYVVAGEAEVAL